MFGSTLSFCLSRAASRGLAANSHPLASSRDSRNSFEMNTYRNRISNPFRMNTYEKTWGGGTPTRPFSVRPCLPRVSPARGALFFTLLPCAATHLPSFQSFPHSLEKDPGVPQSATHPRPCKVSLPLRSFLTTEDCLLTTSSSRPLHPWPHGGTICAVSGLSGSCVIRETFPLDPVSKIQERTTGSTARLIQQLARDRRPGPPAIRSRNPVPPFTEKGRPGKASSVRLGSIVGP